MLKKTSNQLSLFSSLEDMLNHHRPLYRLGHKINLGRFEESFSPLYCGINGRPAHPFRLMRGLLILKHLRKSLTRVLFYSGVRMRIISISAVNWNFFLKNHAKLPIWFTFEIV